MPKHHDRRHDVGQWAKEPCPEKGRRMTAIYEFMT